MDQPVTTRERRTRPEWHRGFPERKVAGVCAGIAHALDLPLPVVRAGFLLLAVFPGFRGLGLVAYLALWLLMPPEPGAPSPMDRLIEAIRELLGAPPQDRQRHGDEPRDL
jgi:phage shock protein PspC (stress-responsive transcriptional regulator)